MLHYILFQTKVYVGVRIVFYTGHHTKTRACVHTHTNAGARQLIVQCKMLEE